MKQQPPESTFKNAEDRQLARILSILTLAAAASYFILLLFGLFNGDWKMAVVAGAAMAMQGIPFWLTKRGKVFAGSMTLMVFVLATMTLLATIGQGIRDIALVTFPIIYIFAGLTFNPTIFRATVALTIVSAGWLTLAERYGWFTPYATTGKPGWSEFGMAVLVLLVAGMTISLLITRMQNNLRQTKANEERFQWLFDQAPVAMVRTRLDDSTVAEANREACHLSGYSRQELSSKPVATLWAHPERRGDLLRILQRDGHIENYEYDMLGKTGNVINCLANFKLYPDRGYLEGSMVDITGRKQAEEERRRLEEKAQINSRLAAVGEMAAGIAHEINNPLTGVLGFSQLLGERRDLPEDVKEGLRIIADGSVRVKDIVKRMLTFARQTKPMRTSADINELIEATLGLRGYVLRTANIEVIKYLAPDLPWVSVDPGQLQQVFLNLIVNAEYAMKKAHGKGTLTVISEKKADHIRISFQDDGTGMSQDTKAKLFNPFFTTKDVGEGTGLGLSLSRSIILEHGGEMSVESAVGKGATFIITLPLTPPAAEAALRAPAVTAPLTARARSARFLVVDDEASIRKLVSTILSAGGHTVDATGDATEALAKLDSTAYDAVLLDIRMPGMSGMEFYTRVIGKHPEMKDKIIFITGDTSDATTRTFLEQNRLSYISKPFDRDVLLMKVKGLL